MSVVISRSRRSERAIRFAERGNAASMLTGHPRRTANAADSLTPSVVLLFHFYDIGEVWQCQSGGKHFISVSLETTKQMEKIYFQHTVFFGALGL